MMATQQFSADLERVNASYNNGSGTHVQEIVALATTAWSHFDPKFEYSKADLSRLGEICRKAAIACVAAETGDPPIWRNRSLVCFSRGQCTNGVALLILPTALASFQQGDPSGALMHLDLMGQLVQSADTVIKAEMVSSAILENKAIVYMSQLGWQLARDALRSALELEVTRGDFRRQQKIKASLTTIEYLDGDPEKAIADLDQIVTECKSSGGAGDIVDLGSQNLALMRRGEGPLLYYQVI